jgi:hypothetical protein
VTQDIVFEMENGGQIVKLVAGHCYEDPNGFILRFLQAFLMIDSDGNKEILATFEDGEGSIKTMRTSPVSRCKNLMKITEGDVDHELSQDDLLVSNEPTILTRFLRGVEIIKDYDSDVEMQTSHGFVYISNYSKTFNQMNKFEKASMERWGWVEGENDLWAFFVT